MMRKLYFLPLLLSAFCSFAKTEDWSAFNIIDIHAHVGSFRGFDLSLPNLQENMQKYGIKMAFISNINAAELSRVTPNSDEVEANEAIVKIVTSEPDRFRGLIWARPNDGSPQQIERFLNMKLVDGFPLFVGIKFHPEMNHFRADDPKVDEYMKLCEKYKIPAVFPSGKPTSNSSPERIYNVAKRHPSLPIVLYHMVAFGPHDPAIRVAKESLKNQDANLYLETAQAHPDAVIRAIEELGSSRVLFGSDASYYGKNHYERYSRLIERMLKELETDEVNEVLNGNARRVFRLKYADQRSAIPDADGTSALPSVS
jgi:predicted TIM-barrel fold metal-dependent hydrolase